MSSFFNFDEGDDDDEQVASPHFSDDDNDDDVVRSDDEAVDGLGLNRSISPLLERPEEKLFRATLDYGDEVGSFTPELQAIDGYFAALERCVEITGERAQDLLEQAARYPTVGPSVTASLKKVRLQQEAQQLRDERDTWLLLKHLLAHRRHLLTHVNPPFDALQEQSQATLVRAFLQQVDVDAQLPPGHHRARSAPLHRLWSVVNWLEALAAEQAEQNTTQLSYWQSFKAAAAASSSSSSSSSDDANKKSPLSSPRSGPFTIDNLIPGSKLLSPADEETERVLLEAVWRQLRAGNLLRAQQILRQEQQHWRAASLGGCSWYYDARLDGAESGADSEAVSSPLSSGNVLRAVFKRVCLALSNKQSLCEYERAVYGLLAGNVEQVLPVCPTWHDQLWLQLQLFIESSVELMLAGHAGPPLYHNPHGRDLYTSKSFDQPVLAFTAAAGSALDIFQALATSSDAAVAQQAASTFAIVQRELVLDERARLVALLCEWVCEKTETVHNGVVRMVPVHPPSLVRFAAHLAIFWTRHEPLDADECQQVLSLCNPALFARPPICDWHTLLLQTYIDQLIDSLQIVLVAVYTAQLLTEDAQVEAYAALLAKLTLRPERPLPFERCLCLAAKYKLPVEKIAKLAASLIDDAARNLPLTDNNDNNNNNNDDDDDNDNVIDRQDAVRIDAISWLCHDPVTYSEALLRANSLARHFLLANKFPAARRLMIETLPRDLLTATSGEPRLVNAEKEYRSIVKYLQVRHDYDAWRTNARGAPDAERLVDGICAVLFYPYGWLEDRQTDDKTVDDDDDDDDDDDEQSRRQYRRLHDAEQVRRQQCRDLRVELIPELVFWLVDIHRQQGELAKAVAVADLVADGERQLYKCFRPQTMQIFLATIREVIMEQLRRGVSDPIGHFA